MSEYFILQNKCTTHMNRDHPTFDDRYHYDMHLLYNNRYDMKINVMSMSLNIPKIEDVSKSDSST